MTFKLILLAATATLAVSLPGPARCQTTVSEEDVIRRVVEDAYVSAVFVTRDEVTVRRGFHPDFVLSVRDDERLIVASLDAWLERLDLDGVPSGDLVKHEFDRIDVTGRTAMVRLRLTINGHHRYTDYMGLYRFSDGWKIVNKVYEEHN